MAPPRPPELMDDVIGEILLRLPPVDPAYLVHASLVCKTWRCLLSDSAFLQGYRTFHWTPPVLVGFFQEEFRRGIGPVPQYVPTIQAYDPRPVPQDVAGASSTTYCRIVDCRHGRVLFQAEHRYSGNIDFTVWDPVTGNHTCISLPVYPNSDNTTGFMAAVFCAVDGCDHLGCTMGPFLVLYIMGTYYNNGSADGVFVVWTSLYSSKTGVWGTSTSVALESHCFLDIVLPSLLIRDAIYFIVDDAEKIFKFSLAGDVVSVMTVPPEAQVGEPNMILVEVQDGKLGVATLEGYSLHLWSWLTDRDGVGEWARCRVIDLAVMIPFSIGDPSTMFNLSGFAQGAGSIFNSANEDIFTVELKSGQVIDIGKKTTYYPIFPFMTFYTPDLVMNARLQGPMRTGRSMILGRT